MTPNPIPQTRQKAYHSGTAHNAKHRTTFQARITNTHNFKQGYRPTGWDDEPMPPSVGHGARIAVAQRLSMGPSIGHLKSPYRTSYYIYYEIVHKVHNKKKMKKKDKEKIKTQNKNI